MASVPLWLKRKAKVLRAAAQGLPVRQAQSDYDLLSESRVFGTRGGAWNPAWCSIIRYFVQSFVYGLMIRPIWADYTLPSDQCASVGH